MIILWTAIAGLSGSCMFSYWLGLIARHNLREVGDGNPGAINLWQSAGYKLGLLGIALDFLKGYLPVLLLVRSGAVSGYGIIPIAIVPILGHALSPFLKGRGGKAIAVTFGVWSALTSFEVSLVYAVILAVLLGMGRSLNGGKSVSTEADGFQVVTGMLLVSVYLLGRAFPIEVLWCCIGNFLLLAYTHRIELSRFLKNK